MLSAVNLLLTAAVVQTPVAEFRFPTEPIGPKSVALGTTGVAAPRDAEAVLNPASLAGAPRLSLHRFDGYAGYNGFMLAGNFNPARPLVVGLAVRHFDYGKLVEDDLGAGTENLDANEQAVSLTTAAALTRRVQIGAAVSYLAEDYFGSVTSATVWSLGGIVSYARQGHIGLAVRSIGGSATNRDAGTRYPVSTRLRIGASHEFGPRARPLTLSLETEARIRRDADPTVHLGAEWKPLPPLALRGGYESLTNPDTAGDRAGRWSLGLGLQLGPATLGMAARFGATEGGEELFLGLDAF